MSIFIGPDLSVEEEDYQKLLELGIAKPTRIKAKKANKDKTKYRSNKVQKRRAKNKLAKKSRKTNRR